jgi:hypothetical protein
MSDSIAQDASNGTSKNVSCGEFLTTLYRGVDPNLWLELRCIDPSGGLSPRVLWSPLGKPGAILKQVQRLNQQGYGAYFAPCPRWAKRGSAEHAAVLVALWADIDCHGDAVKRAQAWERLQGFDLPPSMIVDSGGGWHPYWLFSEPWLLTTDAERQHAASLLRGLFSVLGGDAEYVKSVASVMRLPGLVNTKPERNGAVVTISHFEPERRYPLAAFEWLAVKPSAASKTPALTGTGHALLPRATLDYLNNGALPGERNAALFDAACQFRDAGYILVEAERQLVARYVADGNGEAGREREAQATIASAYKQSPRDPLPLPKPTALPKLETARASVDSLVEQFEPSKATPERPTAAQIAEAVRACASLDPVAWVVERKRIKAIAGDEYRLVDLDRMYKCAQKEAQKATLNAGTPTTERYYVEDGCIVYEHYTVRGKSKQIVACWTGRILEWITGVDDDGQTEHTMRLELVATGRTVSLDVPSELFGDANALTRFIAGRVGGLYTVRAGMNKHLVPALLSLSGEPPQRTTYRFIGWTKVDGKWVYVSPTTSVTADGALEKAPTVELEPRLHAYGLTQSDWSRSLHAFDALCAALPRDLAPALLAFAMLPVIQRFFPAAAPRPAVHLVGTTGSGKSEIASLLTSCYGQFTRDTPPSQWGDTINSVEALGFPLADALYWVDDYKTCYADEHTFTRFLQSYSRGMGRGRLTRESKLRQDRPCRGLLLSTGETTIEGEASVIARMLVLEVPPWERRDPGGKLLAQAESLRSDLAGFTSHFARWIAAYADSGTLLKRIAEDFETNVRNYRDQLSQAGGKQASTGRMIQNWAVLLSVYQLLGEFLTTQVATQSLPVWQDSITQTVQSVQHERAGEVFLNTLAQLLASGEAVLAPEKRHPEAPHPNVPIIGYLSDGHILLLPEVAYREVSRVQSLKFSASAIGAQLKEDGQLVPGPNTLTVQRRVRGIATRVWQLKADFLTCGEIEEVPQAL